MHAKEQKIHLLMIQRRFLEGRIDECAMKSEDGDPSWRYIGYIYPENIEYLNNLGYDVTPVNNELLTAKAGGRSVYLIAPKETFGNIAISDEDLKKSEAYADELCMKQQENEHPSFGSILAGFLGGFPNEPEESESDDGCSDDCDCPEEAPEERHYPYGAG